MHLSNIFDIYITFIWYLIFLNSYYINDFCTEHQEMVEKGIQTSTIKRKLGFPSPFMFSFVWILENISSLYNKIIFNLRIFRKYFGKILASKGQKKQRASSFLISKSSPKMAQLTFSMGDNKFCAIKIVSLFC